MQEERWIKRSNLLPLSLALSLRKEDISVLQISAGTRVWGRVSDWVPVETGV